MAWLYTDTTNHLVFGLLSENYDWLELVEKRDTKSTSELHYLIDEMLRSKNQSMMGLQGHLFAAGPGSYTGMRVSEGMAQVFEWQNVPVYSFYHYEIPRILGVDSGYWWSEAFKGEYFIYNLSENNGKLLSLHDFKTEVVDSHPKNLFTHFRSLVSKDFLFQEGTIIYTGEMIQKYPKKIFSYIVESKIRVAPLYYRSEDKEFKPAKK